MNRSQLWAILIGVFVVLVLIYIFFATGGPENVQEGNPADAQSSQPVTPGTAENQ
ncbi:hypothetical protein [Rubellimicrobium arenae]|uniref:hypothetical protein n=1 Tax=Rubellimicrobium arenae TaxID=2817372 RepID=UPI001B3004ED|nr:hypothetical protein [Rubellimicrobium arenae]